jgi:hypothetical protein
VNITKVFPGLIFISVMMSGTAIASYPKVGANKAVPAHSVPQQGERHKNMQTRTKGQQKTMGDSTKPNPAHSVPQQGERHKTTE